MKAPNNAPQDVVVYMGSHSSAILNPNGKADKAAENREGKRPNPSLTTFDVVNYDYTKLDDVELETIVIGSTEVTLPLGLVVLIGVTSAGKSTLLSTLAATNDTNVTYFGEALDKVEHLQYLLTDERAAMNHIGNQAIFEGKQTCYFDSARFLVFGASVGGTGKGGVDKMLFPQLSALSNLYLAAGKTLVLAINPGDVTEEDYEILVGNFQSSVSTIHYEYSDYVNNPSSSRTVSYALRGPGFDRSNDAGVIVYALKDMDNQSPVYEMRVPIDERTSPLRLDGDLDGLATGNLSVAAITEALSESADED